MSAARVRTTIAIAEDVLRAVDSAVEEGISRSRNEFLEMALKNQLAAPRRAAVDAAFAGMADDSEFQREALEIAGEFESPRPASARAGEACRRRLLAESTEHSW